MSSLFIISMSNRFNLRRLNVCLIMEEIYHVLFEKLTIFNDYYIVFKFHHLYVEIFLLVKMH